MTMIKQVMLAGMILLCCQSISAQNFKYYLNKANTEYRLKSFNLAINSYEEALNKKSDNAEALGKLADCYRHLNRMEDAAVRYAQALSQKRFDPVFMLQYAHVLKALGEYDKAKQWYENYESVDPTKSNHFAQTCDYAKSQQRANTGFFVINEEVSSASSDFGPAYYDNKIAFASASLDLQRSNVNFTGINDNQLFVSSVGPDGSLQQPDFLKKGFKDVYNQGPATFSKDGRTVIYTKNNFTDGTRHIPSSGMELSLFIAEIDANGNWGSERPFPHNGDNFQTGFPYLSKDGQALFFSSDRPGGYGGYDLWISYKTGNTWSTPINLGAVVNSPGDEVSPFFDGNQLFFASNWHPGLGGYDIFRAEQKEGRWNQVFHLGTPINSGYDDYGLIFESFQERGYFTSNRPGGKGAEDLYRVSRTATSSALAIIRVKDASNGAPVAQATLDFSNCGLGIYFADDEGIYKFPLKNANINCEILINKQGYRQESLSVSSNLLNSQPDQQVYLNPDAPGDSLTGPNLGNQYAGSVIDYRSRQPLPGVLIMAMDQSDNTQTQVFSDANGEYSMSLKNNKSYFINYLKEGYQEVNKPVNTTGPYNPNLLDNIVLFPFSFDPGDNNNNNNNNDNDPVTPPVDPNRPGPGPSVTEPNFQEGYSVQVAALSKDKVSEFSNLASIGNVYSKLINGTYKIRVGVFQTQSEAQSALRMIKNKGNSGAFVVREEGVNLGTKGPGPEVSEPEPLSPSSPIAGNSNGYKIQMGAYRNAKSFDSSLVNNLGTVEDHPKGSLTLKLLAVYNSLNEAKSVLSRVKAAGFTTAFIVYDQNGVLTRVRGQ